MLVPFFVVVVRSLAYLYSDGPLAIDREQLVGFCLSVRKTCNGSGYMRSCPNVFLMPPAVIFGNRS